MRTFVGTTVLAAAVWWVVGFLPWLVNGLVFDATSASTEGLFDRTALPMAAVALPELVTYALLGGVLAGLLPRWSARGGSAPTASRYLGVLTGVGVAVLVTLVQSVRSVRADAADTFPADGRLLTGLSVVVLVSTAVGVGLGLLGSAVRPTVSVAGAAAAVLMAGWTTGLLVALGTSPGSGPVLAAGRVITVIVLVLGLWVSTRVTQRAALLWPVAVAVAWVLPSVVTAAVYVAPQLRPGLSGGQLSELVSSSAAVVRASLDPGQRVWWPIAVAVVIGLVSLLLPRRTR